MIVCNRPWLAKNVNYVGKRVEAADFMKLAKISREGISKWCKQMVPPTLDKLK